MGVVKNLMVRVGCDASAFTKGMRDASGANGDFAQSGAKTKAALKGYESPFRAAARASAAYKEQLSAVSRANEAAKERMRTVTQELQQAQEALNAVKAAANGMDLKKSFAEQRTGIEAELEAVNAKLGELQHAMDGSSNNIVQLGDGSVLHIDDAQAQYAAMEAESDRLAAKLSELDEAAAHLGDAFGSMSIKDALKSATAQVDKLGTEAKATEADMKRLAAQTAANGTRGSPFNAGLSAFLKTSGSNIKNLASQFKHMGTQSRSSGKSVTDLLSSIKRIGVISLGLRIASGLFGKLKSTISSCMQENLAFSETVNTIKYQMTQALAPAVNIVTAVLQKIQPILVGIASAISRVVTSIFGGMVDEANAAADAIASAGTYGFDQITKVDASAISSDSMEGTGMFSGIADKITREIEKIKAAIKRGDWDGMGSLFAGYLNGIFSAIDGLNWGEKISNAINAALQTANSLVAGVGWKNLGESLGTNIQTGIDNFNWDALGTLLGECLTGIIDFAQGVMDAVNWEELGGSIRVGIETALESIDWAELIDKVWACQWSNLGAVGEFIWGLFTKETPTVSSTIASKYSKSDESSNNDTERKGYDFWKPKLATGGVVVSPTTALIGEAGTEAVLPLQSNTGWAKTVATLINNEQSGSNEPKIIKVYVGGKKVHEETINYINSVTRANGTCPIHV